MKTRTLNELNAEVARVQIAIENSESEYLRRDYIKYLRRLKREQKKAVYS